MCEGLEKLIILLSIGLEFIFVDFKYNKTTPARAQFRGTGYHLLL